MGTAIGTLWANSTFINIIKDLLFQFTWPNNTMFHLRISDLTALKDFDLSCILRPLRIAQYP